MTSPPTLRVNVRHQGPSEAVHELADLLVEVHYSDVFFVVAFVIPVL